MLTPQEVSSRSFTKAVMGGYNMAMVDEFLDELTDDYTALYKENAGLKAKMKVLVEKVEEYRATEDSMRATLLSVQKMADSIIHEAEQKREKMLSDARSDAEIQIANYRRELMETEERLRQGKEELNRFIAASRALCAQEMQHLEQLAQMKVLAKEEPAAEEISVDEIGELVLEAMQMVDGMEETPAAEESAEEATEEIVEAEGPAAEEETPDYPEGNPFEDEVDLSATRRINLDDLKFGRNYSKDN
ncbi:MAG: DivIVA domain-containing protein [Ruminococcaceae bacterium]|nr:DivIVA domain-containing protein [Oscillospiraceae bacterium]